MKTDLLPLEEVRNRGFEALVNALGAVDALRFIQLFDLGHGDYMMERDRILANRSAREIFDAMRQRAAAREMEKR